MFNRIAFFNVFMTFFVPVVCIVLWLITQAIGYKLVTGDTKKFITQNDLKKTPLLFFSTYMFFWVIVPILYRIYTETLPGRQAALVTIVYGGRIENWILFASISLLIGFLASQISSDQSHFPPWSRFFYMSYAFLLVALAEEFMFRFFMVGRLVYIFYPYLAIAIPSLIFLLFHLQTPSGKTNRIFYFVYVFLVGVFLGYEFYFIKSIWICVLSHFVINLVSNSVPKLGHLKKS